MGLTRKRFAFLCMLTGAALVVAGVWLVWLPGAVILAGAFIGGLGLLGVDIGDRR